MSDSEDGTSPTPDSGKRSLENDSQEEAAKKAKVSEEGNGNISTSGEITKGASNQNNPVNPTQ